MAGRTRFAVTTTKLLVVLADPPLEERRRHRANARTRSLHIRISSALPSISLVLGVVASAVRLRAGTRRREVRP